MGDRLMMKNQGFAGTLPPFVAPYSQTAAALNLVGPSSQRPRVSLSQIVVTPPYVNGMWSPIKRAAIYMALIEFYDECFGRKQQDRYKIKMDHYDDRFNRLVWPNFFSSGVPIVNQPMQCPGALYEPGAGIWSAANLSAVAGTNANASTNYDVSITWADQWNYTSPTAKGNSESAPSARATITVATAQVISVSIVGLTGPNGSQPPTIQQGQGLFTPLNASCWNVYVGLTGQTLYLQNATPVPYATKSCVLPGPPALSGYAADNGQNWNSSVTMQNTIMRG
jgi:hypothetical protein